MSSEANLETISPASPPSNELVNQLKEEATASNHVEVIQTVISSLDPQQSAMVSQGEAGHIWKFNYNTVEVFVQLSGITDDDTFTVWSFVLKLPAKNEAQLMRKLLEMNWKETFEGHFAIVEHQIAVVTSRTVAELSPGEISRAITIVATIADDHNEVLQSEFGAP